MEPKSPEREGSMIIEELLAGLLGGGDGATKRLREEIARLAERGLLDGPEAEEMKRRFLGEVDRRGRRGAKLVKGLGEGLAVAVREALDLPSRGELQAFMTELEGRLQEGASAAEAPAPPLDDPSRATDAACPREVLPGVHAWSIWSAEKGLYFNGYRVEQDGVAVCIDPVDPGRDDQRNALLELGGVDRVVVTNRHHGRAAAWLARATGAEVVMHAREDAPEGLTPDRRVEGGDELGCGLVVVEMPGKTPGEIGLLRAELGGQLWLGDALIGRPAGGLSLPPSAKVEDARQLRRSLRNLLDERFDALLLADGVSMLAEASGPTNSFLRAL